MGNNTVHQEGLLFTMVLGEEYDPIEIQLVDDDNCLLDLTNVGNIYFQNQM